MRAADHAQRAGDQLLRPRAPAAVPLHVVHRAVPALLEPAHQALFVRREVDAGDADLLEAELAAPVADRARQLAASEAVMRACSWAHARAQYTFW